jgi:membrane protein DedA with SNARE-associated domain
MDALQHGSIVFVFLWLAVGGLGAPLPEDVALLAAGALIERGAASPIAMFAVVMFAVLGGDAVLFFGARRLGPSALNRRPFCKLLPPARRAKLEAAYRRHGGLVVFIARNVAGVRAAAFALAGIAGMSPRKFLTCDAAAACIGVPFFMWLGYAGAEHADDVRAALAVVQRGILLAGVVAVAGYLVMRSRNARRRLAYAATTTRV